MCESQRTPSPPGALAYYWSSVRGHWALLQAARPVSSWLADPATPAALRTRLALALHMRDFASARLHLPDNASYRSYAELPRRAAVWNVVAAPPDALTLHQWCFPITGCIGYRGYFNDRARRRPPPRRPRPGGGGVRRARLFHPGLPELAGG